jgi:hypothetical protein
MPALQGRDPVPELGDLGLQPLELQAQGGYVQQETRI